ncbi:hypothetical protein T484DRAFT_1850564 [Baffinella frigidus]|nr:hypothetical protein T484DRAFT_1850564 [Cryptophyta sp. CCMP2293]
MLSNNRVSFADKEKLGLAAGADEDALMQHRARQLHLFMFRDALMQHRARQLHLFMFRVCRHAALSQSRDLLTFLEAKVWALEACAPLSTQQAKVWALEASAPLSTQQVGGMLFALTKDADVGRMLFSLTKDADGAWKKLKHLGTP